MCKIDLSMHNTSNERFFSFVTTAVIFRNLLSFGVCFFTEAAQPPKNQTTKIQNTGCPIKLARSCYILVVWTKNIWAILYVNVVLVIHLSHKVFQKSSFERQFYVGKLFMDYR